MLTVGKKPVLSLRRVEHDLAEINNIFKKLISSNGDWESDDAVQQKAFIEYIADRENAYSRWKPVELIYRQQGLYMTVKVEFRKVSLFERKAVISEVRMHTTNPLSDEMKEKLESELSSKIG